MNQETIDPTNCDRCAASLERGWTQRWKDDKLIESLCFLCDEADRADEYKKNRVITSRLMTSAAIAGVHMEYRVLPGSRSYGSPPGPYDDIYREINESTTRLYPEVKTFERAVWFGGLQAQVKAAEFRGFRLDFNNNIALVYSLAGRTQITIETEKEDTQISLITADDSDECVMGINSMRATEKQAMQLLISCRAAFLEGKKFKRNNKVGIGI